MNRISKRVEARYRVMRYYQRIIGAAKARGYTVENLGEVDGDPILFLGPPQAGEIRVLVAAGFHGDEPAGPLAVLSALETLPDFLLNAAQVSFLPLVNPSGFRWNTRLDSSGLDMNRGFCHPEKGYKLAPEGRVLVEHLNRLKEAGRDLLLTLHEDVDEHRFYLYIYESKDRPGPLGQAIFDEGLKHFELARGAGEFRDHDSSFDDLLFHEGVPHVICMETPCLEPIEDRISCHVAMIRTAIEFLTKV